VFESKDSEFDIDKISLDQSSKKFFL
jgi:hypothetical protein